MISVQNYRVTVRVFYYAAVGGMAKTRMRNKMCKYALGLVEHSSEQTVVCISAVISFIAKFILLLVVFNKLMLCEDIEKKCRTFIRNSKA